MRTKPLLILSVVIIGIFSLWWFVFRNPLAQYGLSWTTEKSGGASGSYRWVSFTREWHGKHTDGPSVGGSYPSVRFADLDGDGILDIIVEDAVGGTAQFALTFPTSDSEPLFRLIGKPTLSVGYPPLHLWTASVSAPQPNNNAFQRIDAGDQLSFHSTSFFASLRH